MKYLIFLFYIFVFILFLRPISPDGDFFHHLNTGRYVLENGKVPREDTWTFTAYGRQWIPHSWGSGVIFYLIYQIFGATGISFFVSFVAVGSYILLFKLLRKLKVGISSSFLIMLPTIPVVLLRFPSRPEIFTYALLLSLLYIASFGDFGIKQFLITSFIFLLWTNLYGASVLFGVLIFIFVILAHLLKGYNSKKKYIYLSILSAIVVPLINPNGFSSIFYYFLIPKVIDTQGEWASLPQVVNFSPLDIYISYQYLIIVYLLFLLFYFFVLITGFRSIKYNFFWFVVSLGIFFPFISFRQTALAAFLATPFLALFFQKNEGRIKKVYSGMILIIIFLSFFFLIKAESIFCGIGKQSDYPESVVKFLRKYKIDGNIFANQRIGSYLSYNLPGKIKIFHDTRDELYQETDVFSDYKNAIYVEKDIIPMLKKYMGEVVVADYVTEGIAHQKLFYADDFRIVFVDDRYFVAIKKDKADKLGLKVYQAIDPFAFSLAKDGQENEAVREYEKIYQKNSSSIQNTLQLARIYLRQRKFDKSLELLESLSQPKLLGGKNYSQTDKILDKIHRIFGPNRDDILTGIAKEMLIWEIFINQRNCHKTKESLDRLTQFEETAIFFPKKRKFPTNSDIGWALFYLACQKDYKKAETYLNYYQNRLDIHPKEKLIYTHMYQSYLSLE